MALSETSVLLQQLFPALEAREDLYQGEIADPDGTLTQCLDALRGVEEWEPPGARASGHG